MPTPRCAFASLFAASFLIAALTPASAQTAAPAADIPKHSCVKPGEYPGRLATERQQRAWQREMATYSECMKKFAEDQRMLSDMHIKAANTAINEHNEFVRVMSDEALKAAQ